MSTSIKKVVGGETEHVEKVRDMKMFKESKEVPSMKVHHYFLIIFFTGESPIVMNNV